MTTQYDDIFVCFSRIATREAWRLNPQGWDEMPSELAPNSLQELQDYHARHGVLGISKDHSQGTIYETPSANMAFRAWHDRCHLIASGEFDRAGEYRTFLQQTECLRRYELSPDRLAMMVNIVRCEIIGQFDYNVLTGGFPQYQRQFTVDYLQGKV